MARKTSPIWKLTAAQITAAPSAKHLLEQVGLRPFTGNYRTLRKKVESLGIDYATIVQRGLRKGTTQALIPMAKLLVAGKRLLWTAAKRRLFDEGVLEEKCCECGIGPEWNGKPLVLQIDHINGDVYDNRLENLRALCPNCHTQTPTWGARRHKSPPRQCPTCGTPISRKASKCRSCAGSDPEVVRKREAGQQRATKIAWPSGKSLTQMVKKSSYEAVGRQLGVSGNAVRNRIRRHGAQ